MTESQFRGFVVAAVCVAGILAYADSFTNGFVWDDASSVLLNKHIQDPHEFTQLFREDQHPFGRGQGNFYRPLVAASFMLDFAMARSSVTNASTGGIPDVSPFLFHLTNLIWHLAVAILLFAILRRLRAPRLVAAAVPLLYVVHPLHTEAVTYISGRADSMAAAFMFLGLLLSMRGQTPIRRILAVTSCWICYALALLCKESAFIFPALLVLLTFAKPQTETSAGEKPSLLVRLTPTLGALVMLVVYGALRASVLNFAKGAPPQPSAPWGQRLLEVGQAFATYIRLIFVPTHLHMERALTNSPAWLAVVGYLLVAGLVCAAVFALRRGHTRIALGMAWFFVTWLPISGVFPLNAPLAEHWLYVPLAGFLWALLEVVTLVAKRNHIVKSGAPVAIYAAMAALLVLTVHRNRDWKDNETLYLATLAENPASVRVQYNLAVTYQDILHNLPAARRHYEAVLALLDTQRQAAAIEADETAPSPLELESLASLGEIALKQKDYGKAARRFQQILKLHATDVNRPVLAEAAFGMAKCSLYSGDMDQALKTLRMAVAAQPELKGEAERLLATETMAGVL